MPKTEAHSFTKGKLAILVACEKKLAKFFKPYGLSKKSLDKLIDKEFLGPIIKADSDTRLTLKDFRVVIKKIYDDVTEIE
jgi:hypothetical protein